MYKLNSKDIRLIMKYQHDMDGLIDVIKVICNDAYNTGADDGYDLGFKVGYDYRRREEENSNE